MAVQGGDALEQRLHPRRGGRRADDPGARINEYYGINEH
jgi:hypothetical protein